MSEGQLEDPIEQQYGPDFGDRLQALVTEINEVGDNQPSVQEQVRGCLDKYCLSVLQRARRAVSEVAEEVAAV